MYNLYIYIFIQFICSDTIKIINKTYTHINYLSICHNVSHVGTDHWGNKVQFNELKVQLN